MVATVLMTCNRALWNEANLIMLGEVYATCVIHEIHATSNYLKLTKNWNVILGFWLTTNGMGIWKLFWSCDNRLNNTICTVFE